MLNLFLTIEKILPLPLTEVGDGSGDELDILPETRIGSWGDQSEA